MMNFFVENPWLSWAIVALICLIAELMVSGFFILCFAFGAVLSAIVAALGLNFEVQLFVFAVSSLISLFFLRPLVKKFVHPSNNKEYVSNADAIIGRRGVVSQDIPAKGYGRVALDGDDWKAYSLDGMSIEKGKTVEICLRESLIIAVKEVNAVPC